MGLIDFLDEVYEGGKLLFLMHDHRKQVKLRYKAIKDSSIKRLPNLSGVTISESTKRAQKQALVAQQYDQYMWGVGDISSLARTVNSIPKPKIESALEDEVKISIAQGFEVTVRDDYISVRCLRTGLSEWTHIANHVETPTKLSMIIQMKDNLVRQGALLRRPLPSNSMTSRYNDVSGGVFGAIGAVGSLATTTCNSITRGSNGINK